MKLLRRQYLDRLRRLPGAPAITAVTGIRRAGKSVLLRQFAAELRGERHVVYVDRESSAVSWRIWFSWSCAVAATR